MPKKLPEDKRSEHLEVALTPGEMRDLNEDAAADGMSRSEWVRRAIAERKDRQRRRRRKLEE